MRRTLSAAGSWGFLVALAASAGAGDDGPPPLTTPAEAPARAAKPLAPAPRASTSLLRPRATVPARGSATAAKPGAAGLPSGPPVAAPPDIPPALDEPPPMDGPPPLDGPSEMRRLPDRLPGGAGISRRRMEFPEPAEGSPPLDAPPTLTLEPERVDGDRPPSLAPEAVDGEDKDEDVAGKTKPQRLPLPPRRGLGLTRAFSRSRDRQAAGREPAIRVEPRSDPAADAALKRKLEARVKDAVGDRARDVEVNVVDRNVVVRARVDRIWNRRAVRRTIEGLPMLSGYKARVEIND